MKRYLIIIFIVLITCGCVKINDASIDELINTTINSKYNLYNHVNSGYKYYLPRDMNSVITDDYNEIIKDEEYDYYLYVDLVAYYNKKQEEYSVDNKKFYSLLLNKDDKKGIVNIDKQDDMYIVVIKYNYAKIEVKCESKDLNEVVVNSLVVLSSIDYIDDVIEELLNESEFAESEEQVNIFKNENDGSNYLDEIDDTYTGNEEDDYDPDVIKERG